MLAPLHNAVTELPRQLGQHFIKVSNARGVGCATTSLALLLGTTQQSIKLLGYEFAVAVQFMQKGTTVCKSQRQRDPLQVGVGGGQYVGLLVVQVLDAVLHLAQKNIGLRQRVGGSLGHQPCCHQPLQRVERGARAQFGELAATHHLQQLHREFNLAYAPAR